MDHAARGEKLEWMLTDTSKVPIPPDYKYVSAEICCEYYLGLVEEALNETIARYAPDAEIIDRVFTR
jgi:hypothetical protein